MMTSRFSGKRMPIKWPRENSLRNVKIFVGCKWKVVAWKKKGTVLTLTRRLVGPRLEPWSFKKCRFFPLSLAHTHTQRETGSAFVLCRLDVKIDQHSEKGKMEDPTREREGYQSSINSTCIYRSASIARPPSSRLSYQFSSRQPGLLLYIQKGITLTAVCIND